MPTENDYFINADERIYIDLRDSNGYTVGLEKLRCNDSTLIIKISLKKLLAKKIKLFWGDSKGRHL